MSTNRIIVDAKVYDGFVDRFTTHVMRLKVGNPNEPDTAIGPVINQNQLKGHLAHIQGARAAGARQVLGGDPKGQVLPPHVFVDVTNDMRSPRTKCLVQSHRFSRSTARRRRYGWRTTRSTLSPAPSSHATRSAACHLRWICTPA